MSKKKFFLIISILTLILIFVASAICGQCGTTAEDEDKIDVVETEEDTEEDTQPPGGEDGDAQKEAPTIKLEIYEGPAYSVDDDVCFYRVKADVTGIPSPSIEWSKDDSNGAWGDDKAQVNIESEGETYTLTAQATNSEGTAEDSIELSWECDAENNPPEITEIKISPGDIFIGSIIDVEAVATDPDGDSLKYLWSCDEGSFSDEEAMDTEWTAPDTAQDYEITVTVNDQKGGTATKTKTITVLPMLGTALAVLELIGNETGCINTDDGTVNTSSVFIGQDTMAMPKEGYLSFNIESFSSTDIVKSTLTLENPNEGIPRDDFGSLILHSIYYGPGDLNATALGSPNRTFLISLPNSTTDISYSGQNLTDAIIDSIDSGEPRFQIRIKWEHPNPYLPGLWHGLDYQKSNIYLTIESGGS